VQYWLMLLSRNLNNNDLRNLNNNDLLRVALWVGKVLEQQGTCKSRELFGEIVCRERVRVMTTMVGVATLATYLQ
jgi:hypothetical protein